MSVLLVATGAAWESAVLGALAARPGLVVLRRCVDVDDLIASATTGQADVAVVALDAHGLDAAAAARLARDGVRIVGVAPDPAAGAARARAARIGLSALVGEADPAAVAEAAAAPGSGGLDEPVPPGEPAEPDEEPEPSAPGRVVAVWGPAGGPGRTTVALGLAAELAHRGGRALVVDADPYGGAVAQQLGVMDEVSGLLAAARLAATGDLTTRFATVQRSVAPRLRVVTGLPRPDRWREVRPGCLEHLLELARASSDVVVDVGFCLEDEPSADLLALPGRNALTLTALAHADEVVVVGAADPVGLARLARGLVEVREALGGRACHVVVNRMRPGLGWSEREVAGMLAGFGPLAGLHFLPEDRASVDRALVAGHTLPESGDGPLRRALVAVADGLWPASATPPRRTRRGGRRRARAA